MNKPIACSLYFDIEHVTLDNHRARIELERVEDIVYADQDIPDNLIALDNALLDADINEED